MSATPLETLPTPAGIHDIAIIGGGVNGCGIARDAAGRGWSVSSARGRSRRRHLGGLDQAGAWRAALSGTPRVPPGAGGADGAGGAVGHRPAHHLAAALRAAASPGLRPAWLLRLGLFLYDHLGGRKQPAGDPRPRPAAATRRACRCNRAIPAASNIPIAGSRTPGWWCSMRRGCGGARRRHPPAHRAGRGRPRGRHLAAGARGAGGGRETIRARALVNAAGPWVAEVLRGGCGSTRRARPAGQGQPHRRAAALRPRPRPTSSRTPTAASSSPSPTSRISP